MNNISDIDKAIEYIKRTQEDNFTKMVEYKC